MAQANKVSIVTSGACAWLDIEMFPTKPDGSAFERPLVRITIERQLMTPADLRVVARLLEQAADRKEGLFTVDSAS